MIVPALLLHFGALTARQGLLRKVPYLTIRSFTSGLGDSDSEHGGQYIYLSATLRNGPEDITMNYNVGRWTKEAKCGSARGRVLLA